MKSNDYARLLAAATAEPDLAALHTDLLSVLTQAGGIRSRQQAAHNLRYCKWDGQSDDYRRHEEDLGRKATPFEGAPDERVPVIDTVVRERVALYWTAVMDSEIQATPIGSDEQGDAAKVTRLLRWARQNVLQKELKSEVEIAANYAEGDDPGIALLKVWWLREPGLELRHLTTEELATMLLEAMGFEADEEKEYPPEAGPALTEAADLLSNREREEDAMAWLQQPAMFPTVEPKLLRKALRELRKTGATQLPVPYVKSNRPCIKAKRYMQEVFFRSEYDDVQDARVVHEREFVTESELRARVIGYQYDAGWVARVLEAGPGPGEFDASSSDPYLGALPRYNGTAPDAEVENLYEVWTAYYVATNAYGIPGTYWTVYSLKVEGEYGYHGLLGYPHGGNPFVQLRAEHTTRGTENVRGAAELAGSRQAAIKLQRDSRGAHTMLSTVPPYSYHSRLSGVEITFGPLTGIERRDPSDVQFMPIPQFPAASKEMEQAAWDDLAQLFGRPMNGQTSELGGALLKHAVGRWLAGWVQVWQMVLDLQQAYGDPVVTQLVTGGPLETISREEIRGKYTIALKFSVADLNLEFAIKRIDALKKAMELDLAGEADYTEAFRASIRGIDPGLAETILRDPAAATKQQVEDEQNRVAKMATGVEPPALTGPSNARLRYQSILETVNGSPVLARRFHTPATPDDELFRQLVEKEIKNLGFLNQQFGPGPEGNRAIGRSGVKPVTAGAA